MNHSLYQDEILKALPFKRLPCFRRRDRIETKAISMKATSSAPDVYKQIFRKIDCLKTR